MRSPRSRSMVRGLPPRKAGWPRPTAAHVLPPRSWISRLRLQLKPEERRAFPAWREQRRPSGQNLLDEPDRQVNDRNQRTK